MNSHDARQQNDLKKQLALDDSRLSFETATLTDLKYVGGVDLSFPLGDHENAVACLVVMQMPDLQVQSTCFPSQTIYILTSSLVCIGSVQGIPANQITFAVHFWLSGIQRSRAFDGADSTTQGKPA